ncbi:2-amino-4-hydroxy-6-hydroxymethyldihydropteridine diphosphokinase [Romboutsia timonensis]|uniref:2-amino-4-hydroxy-6- hydroxymethyldihydropteridine diphosphokinase n=1 Tax=Romboutsia timonensis TaxID=1776391 RepID=UPI0023F9A918|nr:2-amino-4-hydroxy-6-hydroxymethyldihydropteridine diphosphokinase [Romboutsia timonensis]MCI6667112.1 2-amino-4-hydroxy-6-hydroxymethyldihydropteridine diphosphokinase [Romboutsia timonensis]MDY3959087.1 2-amino-4-hydroxy-6-hydroxymethyldihydropteridine diphosphokinase [Romboutsia timonensis]
MDKIHIKDLEIIGFHGAIPEEKVLGQKFVLSFELDVDLRQAGKNDDLTKTVHYGELAQKVEEEFTKTSYDLIEKAAEEICEFVLLNYPLVKKVKLLLKKPWAPTRKHVEYVAVEIERKWNKVYIAAGSNLGNKEETLKEAIDKIDKRKDCVVTKVSNFYTTDPVGYEDQDQFVNCVFEIDTLQTPSELMDTLLEVEKDFKRERIIRWGPRTLDLDIIFYDDIISYDEHILIPHPRAHERQFVMKPMCDINPYYVHPIYRKRVMDISSELGEL